MSLIIVGVGDADFAAMEELDADGKLVTLVEAIFCRQFIVDREDNSLLIPN